MASTWIRWCNAECHNVVGVNTMKPKQNGHHLQMLFSWTKLFNLFKISLKFVPNGQIDKKPTLVQIITLDRIGDIPEIAPFNRATSTLQTIETWCVVSVMREANSYVYVKHGRWARVVIRNRLMQFGFPNMCTFFHEYSGYIAKSSYILVTIWWWF